MNAKQLDGLSMVEKIEAVLTDTKVSEDDDAATRAHEGSLFLDEIVPDWFLMVPPQKLDMSEDSACMFGHVFGSYGDVTKAWIGDGVTVNGWELSADEAMARLGFFDGEGEYADLNEAWRFEIEDRLELWREDRQKLARSALVGE